MPLAAIRRTKIVATLGPAWSRPEQMHQLFDDGVNVVRVNCSHGTPEIRREWILAVHKVRGERRDAIGLLLDLQGPRIRVGMLPKPFSFSTVAIVVASKPITAPMPPFLACDMSSPRFFTSSRPVRKSNTPAASSALYSPKL